MKTSELGQDVGGLHMFPMKALACEANAIGSRALGYLAVGEGEARVCMFLWQDHFFSGFQIAEVLG